MIAKGTPHRDGAILARYLVTGKGRERAELWELRGFLCTGIVAAFRSVHVMAAATKCLAPFFHVSVRNADGDNLDRSQWELVANSVERMLGLTDQPRAIAFHTAEDTGHSHMHIAWSRINQDTLTAKPLPFFKQRLKQVCRELEERFSLTPVPNERRGSIRFAPTRAEEEQARRLGLDVHDTRECIRHCFERSECGQSFRNAIAQEGLVLARGDRRDFLVVDRAGGIHALGKRIVAVSAAQIRDRFADLCRESLPTLEQLRSSIAARHSVTPDQNAADTVQQEISLRDQVDCGKTMHPHVYRGKRRTAGRESRPKPAQIELPNAKILVSQDPMPLANPLVGPGLAEPQRAPIHEGADQRSLAAPNRTCIEPLSTAGADQGDKPRPLRPSEPESIGDPRAPPCPKATGFTAQIKGHFRALVKELTVRVSSLSPRKRRREENGGAFRAAAKWFVRRAARVPPLDFLDPSWEPFTWLRLWEYNDPASMDLHPECHATPASPADHSPHL